MSHVRLRRGCDSNAVHVQYPQMCVLQQIKSFTMLGECHVNPDAAAHQRCSSVSQAIIETLLEDSRALGCWGETPQ